MPRTPLIIGNWKMNVDHVAAVTLVQELARALRDAAHDPAAVEVVVLPPFTALRSVQVLIEGDRLQLAHGAQDVSAHAPGARTGDIAASLLVRLGVAFVTVGHSERREHHGEDDATVAAKAVAALTAGTTPVVCVGEPLEVRHEGRHVEHVLAQLDVVLDALTAEQVSSVVVAYEPVWAIGTGEVATPDDAQEVCAAIRGRVAVVHGDAAAQGVRVVYGGSVKSGSIAALMTRPDVDGALVGGASLDAREFAAIVTGAEAAARAS